MAESGTIVKPARVFAIFVGLLLTGFFGLVHAQQDACIDIVQSELEGVTGGVSVYAVLNGERALGCVLGPTDTSGIAGRYQVLFDASRSATEKAIARAQIFDLSLAQFAGEPGSICDGQHVTACMVGRHVNKLNELRNALVASATDPQDPILSASQWTVRDANGEIAISNVKLQAYLMQECAGEVTEPICHAAIKRSANFMRTSLAMVQVIAAHNLPTIEAGAEFLSQRDLEWDEYFNGISVQYPWELAFNSWRFTKHDDQDKAKFPRAPNSKFVLLHPSLGFEHIDTPLGYSATNGAVLLELLGYERWRWRDGKATNRWGISAIASLASVPRMDDIGYGLLIHTPIREISIGAIYRDGDLGSEIGFVLNFNLSKLITQYKNVDVGEFLSP